MMRSTFNEMSIDELWALHKSVEVVLAAKLTAKKDALDFRLKQLNPSSSAKHRATKHHRASSRRRPYPKVLPKFRDPDRPSDTWAGRGRQPRWLSAQLKSGKQINDFRIDREAA